MNMRNIKQRLHDESKSLSEAGIINLIQEGQDILSKFSPDELMRARIRMTLAATVAREVKETNSKEALYRKKIPNGPLLATNIERETIKKMLEEKSIDFSEEEREKLLRYHTDLERSADLNFAITALRYVKEEKAANIALKHLSVEIMRCTAMLQPGESLYLDYSHAGHAMRFSIQNSGSGYVFRLYETRGIMDFVDRYNSNTGLSTVLNLKLPFEYEKSLQYTAQEIFVPYKKMESDGQKYLANLFERVSGMGRIKAEKAAEKASHNKMARLKKFNATLKRFQAIADADNPMTSVAMPQTKQITNNCWAKRIQACQMHALGKKLYKKVRLSSLMQQREILRGELQAILKEGGKLSNLNQGILNHEALSNECKLIGSLVDLPTPEYFKALFENDKVSLEFYTKRYQKKYQKNPTSEYELIYFASTEAMQAILNVIDHSIAKLETRREIVLTAPPKSTVTLSDALLHAKVDDVKNATLVAFYDPDSKVKNYKVKLLIKNVEKFVDPDVFLRLYNRYEDELKKNPEAIKIKNFLLFKIEKKMPKLEKLFKSKEAVNDGVVSKEDSNLGLELQEFKRRA
jgi:hypothetical protein